MARFNKKLFLALSFSVFFCSLVLVPAVQGYGTSYYTAETIYNGSTSETMYSYDDYAYFQIYASAGNSLSISLSYNYDGIDVDVRLYSPSQVQVDSSSNTLQSEYLTYTCTTSGNYYIVLYRFNGVGDTSIYMTVSGASSTPSVPGFDVATMLLATACAAALAIVLLKKKGKIGSA
jgi:hypothetical protein